MSDELEFSPQKIAKLRDLASKATPRPWEVEPDLRPDIYSKSRRGGYENGGHVMTVDNHAREDRTIIGWQSKQYNMNDADYIVSAANLLPSALDEIERLHDYVKAANAELKEFKARVAELEYALKVYADHDNWTSEYPYSRLRIWRGDEAGPNVAESTLEGGE